jgi:presenilin-like A22 family membrane protease
MVTRPKEKAFSILSKDALITAGLALLLLFCLAGTIWTAYWSLRFGLAPRPPLSTFQTLIRLMAVTAALLLLLVRRDHLERTALACAVIAAGSSALFGLGLDSIPLQVVRLLFHFLAYSLGAVAIIRWFIAKRGRRARVKAATL